MLKGFLILVFISSAIGFIALQATKPHQLPADQIPVDQAIESTEESLDVDNLVFYKLVRPKNENTSLDQKNKTISSPIKSKSAEQKESEEIESNQSNSDAIEQVINKQQSEEEIASLIDNLDDLQQKIEGNK